MRTLKRCILSAGSAAVALLIVEGAGRLLLTRPTLPYVPSSNPRLIYELNPAYQGINTLGMRQPEIDRATVHDRFVIVVIGDSHSYMDDSVTGAGTFPARLEHHANAAAERPVTVLNLGVPGYNMIQELEVLRAKALAFEPDLIVLQYCVNDDHISNFIQPEYPRVNRAVHSSVVLTTAWTTILYSQFGRTHLLPFVEDHAPDLLLFTPGLVGTPVSREQDPLHGPTHPTRSKDLVPVRYHGFIGRDNFESAVHTFGEICRRARIPTLATGFIEERDRGLYEASGFQVYSFFDIFAGTDMRHYGYDPRHSDGHFSDLGNDLIGKALASYVREHFSVSSPKVARSTRSHVAQ